MKNLFLALIIVFIGIFVFAISSIAGIQTENLSIMGAAGVRPALSKGQPNGAPAASQMLQFTSSGHVLVL